MPQTMDHTYFVEWRKRCQLTQAKLADLLNVNIYTVKKWEGGSRKLPPYIGLLMAAIEKGLEPIGREAMIEVEGSGDGD
jgi:DNA-binding transcriptional regulator YiaG